MKNLTRQNWQLAVLALLHGLIDLLSIGGLMAAVHHSGFEAMTAFKLIALYNLLAFSGQTIAGLLLDETAAPRKGIIAGCLLVALSWWVFPMATQVGVLLAGSGNALFHVGAGMLTAAVAPGRAAPFGLLVAPGAWGVMGGMLLAKSPPLPVWLPALLLPPTLLLARFWSTVLSPASESVLSSDSPDGTRRFLSRPAEQEASAPEKSLQADETAAHLPLPLPSHERASLAAGACLLGAVAIRSFVGLNLAFPWKTELSLLVFLTSAVVLGKSLGGFLADRFGWERLSTVSLVGATFLLGFDPGIVWAGIAGMFLFNLVMPVTLAAVMRLTPRNPGFGFGLTCLALNLGVLPIQPALAMVAPPSWLFWLPSLLSLIAAALIATGLRLMRQTVPSAPRGEVAPCPVIPGDS